MSNNNILKSNIQLGEINFKNVAELALYKLDQLNDDHVCLIEAESGQQLTVSELKSRSNSISVALINRGITKTDRIAFCGQNSIQHSILYFANYFIGTTFMPLSPTLQAYEVEQEIRAVGANVILTSDKELLKFDKLFNNRNDIKLVVVFDGKPGKYPTFQQLLEEGRHQTLDRIPYFDVNPKNDILFLINTSGSTGRLECAMIEHRVIINKDQDMMSWLKQYKTTFQDYNTIGVMSPFGHISGTTHIPLYVMNGLTVILFTDIKEKPILKSIEKYKINILQTLPHICRRIIEGSKADNYDLGSLKVIINDGSVFPGHIARALIDRYSVKFIERYGSTEYVLITRGCDLDEEFIPGNLGRVTTGTELKIVDLTTGESLGPDINGEICIRGNKMFFGYLYNNNATKDAFDRDGWYRTGDIGHYDHKERLFITDRLKQVTQKNTSAIIH